MAVVCSWIDGVSQQCVCPTDAIFFLLEKMFQKLIQIRPPIGNRIILVPCVPTYKSLYTMNKMLDFTDYSSS